MYLAWLSFLDLTPRPVCLPVCVLVVLQSLIWSFCSQPFWIDVLTCTLGQSLTASPKTMSVWSLIESRQSPTVGEEESAEQKSEEGAETREKDDPNASQEFSAGLEQHDRDDEKDGHEEGWDAEANEEVEHEEKEQETQKDNDPKAEEEDDNDEEAKAKENELAKEKTEAEKQDEDHEKVEHEDQKQQTQKEKDREEDEEEDDKDANEADKEHVKEVAGNADAKAHQHEEREGAEEPVTKRDRALKTHTSDEVEPPKKVNKCSLLSPKAGPGLDLVDRRAATSTGLGVPLATGHGESTSTLTPQKWEKRGRSEAAFCQSIRLPRTRRQTRLTKHQAAICQSIRLPRTRCQSRLTKHS